MADRQLNRPLVSINIPCFRQLAEARRCLESVLSQTLADFELTLYDDGESDDYREYVASLGDARVRYHRNAERLGAMRNMFHAVHAGSAKYTLAFHEDDLLNRHFLASAVSILETHPSCGFVAAELREFTDEPSPAQLAAASNGPSYDLFESPADFLRGILGGLEPMFGSVVYRRAALAGIPEEHETYGTLVDRPFLLAIMRRWSAAMLREPLVWYRHHGDNARHKGMHADHIVHLLSFYRSLLTRPLDARDEALFYTYSGYWLFRLFELTPDDQRPSLRRYLFRVWRNGLYQPRWRGRFGLRLIQRALLGQENP